MKSRALAAGTAAALLLGLAVSTPAAADTTTSTLTVATFNASLNRSHEGELLTHLTTGDNIQAQNVAETIQRINPDIVLVNEFDYDPEHKSANFFRKNYLEVGHNGAAPVVYPYLWTGPVNTGVPSGFDLNNDGTVKPGDDAWGFGLFPGQYGLVVYSKYPIKMGQVRTFQKFLWKDMPGAALPEKPDGTPWYEVEEIAQFPLSSKTHADIPIDINGTIVHILAAHPTPPAFDGEEKRNQKRNHDEIRLWADYIAGTGTYLYDDNGRNGPLAADAHFVIMGDYNADPEDGNAYEGAIRQLLSNPRVLDPQPTSAGGPQESALQGGANTHHKGNPIYDTADFSDARTGNLRVDYVLPSVGTKVEDAQVFWPTRDDALFRLTGLYKDPLTGERQPFPTSDHRAVWVKLKFPARAGQHVSPSPSPSNCPSPSASAHLSASAHPLPPSVSPTPGKPSDSPRPSVPSTTIPVPSQTPNSRPPSPSVTASPTPAPSATAPGGPRGLARTGVIGLNSYTVILFATLLLGGGLLVGFTRRRN